jgi:hypothetical protein
LKSHNFWKENWVLISGIVFILVLVGININNFFFWDSVQLGSKHASFYYFNNYSSLLLPDEIDSGHIPAFGMYLALIWKLFGRSLWISHLSMLPFVLGIAIQLYKLLKRFVVNKHLFFAFFLVLLDPTLLSQMTLISPDVPLTFFFLLGLNATLNNKAGWIMISAIFLFLTSMRGMMISLCILFLDLYHNIFFKENIKSIIPSLLKKGLKYLPSFLLSAIYKQYAKETFIKLFKRSLIYLPALLIFIAYSLFHYREKGWIGFHQNSSWAECFEPVGLNGFIYNIGILGWRMIDFGRIGVWISFIILFTFYHKQILNNSKTHLLLFLFILSFILLPANMLWAKNLTAHRYLIPLYLIFSIFCAQILFSFYVKEKLRYALITLWGTLIISGNFWIYPNKISMGWDSTLAHLPYYDLRNKALEYLDKKGINFNAVASFFPNEASLNEIDLTGDQRKFSIYNGKNQYVFYSNIYNIDDQIYDEIYNEYEIIQKFNKNRIYIHVLEKKK